MPLLDGADLRRAKLHEPISAQLAQEIVSGRIAPGEAIPSEPALAAAYGVSKAVAHETVQALAAAGLARIQHGKRTFVLPEEEWNVLNPLVEEAFLTAGRAVELVESLYQVRLIIEPYAARWTASLAGDDQLRELERIVEEMGRAFEHELVQQALSFDRAFHVALASMAGNRVLRAILLNIHELVLSRWLFSELSLDDLGAALDQHREILAAIMARDAERAAERIQAHLEWAIQTDRTSFSALPSGR